jgi:hypothetical protein
MIGAASHEFPHNLANTTPAYGGALPGINSIRSGCTTASIASGANCQGRPARSPSEGTTMTDTKDETINPAPIEPQPPQPLAETDPGFGALGAVEPGFGCIGE